MFRLPFLSSGAAHSSPCYRLSVISPYAAELGFFLDIDRLRVQGTHVLPALQSALTLWSAHITSTSEPDHVQSHERAQTLTSNLLSQTQAQLASALSTLDDEFDPAIFLHVIQTGVLLAYYMQRIGQEVGARYYASGTWALGAMLKLYRSPHLSAGVGEGEGQSLRGGDVREGSMYGNASAFVGGARLKPALDGIEAEERVRAFWALYALDRWFSAVGQGPCQSFATDENAMTVPWPDAGSMDEVSQLRPLFLLARLDTQFGLIGEECGPASSSRSKSRLYAGWSFCDACQGVSVARRGNGGRGVVCGWYTPSSYLILSCVLIGYFFLDADRAVSQTPAFRARFGTLDALLQRCLNVAMTMATGRQSQPQALVMVHLVAFAHITLHRPFISTYEPSRRRCAEAALGVVRVLDRMGEMGVGGNQSPIYAVRLSVHAMQDEWTFFL